MKKTAALFAALMLIVGSMAVASEVGSFAEARTAAAKLGKPLLVEFYTEW